MADFLERLRSGPPIVADGGMGALLDGATPGLRCPEEANLRAPESVSPCTRATSAPGPS